MPIWSQSMQRSFEYYKVDPVSWGDIELIPRVINCTITRDLNNETLGSASIDADDDINDTYVRPYLITLQNGVRERFPLGTFLCASDSRSWDGRKDSRSFDCYTPLIELKEKPMPIGYTIMKDQNLLTRAVGITRDSTRAPVADAKDDRVEMTLTGNFIAESSETRLNFVKDLLATGNYSLGLDERGGVLFLPYQELASLQAKFIYRDDNMSLIYPDISISGDLFDIPNVLEIIYSVPDSGKTIYVTVRNEDPNSILSIPSRGREIVKRDSNPDVVENTTETDLRLYALNAMKKLSTVQCEIKYKHGFTNEVQLGDCVRFEYKAANLNGVNAKVTRQVIHCNAECSVEETAVFPKNLSGVLNVDIN